MKAARVIAALLALGVVGAVGYLAGERSATVAVEVAVPGDAPGGTVARRAAPMQSTSSPRLAMPTPTTSGGSAAPLPPLNVPVAGLIEDLKKQAAAGNVPAACRLAFELDRCENGPRHQRSAATFANLAAQSGTGPELARRYMGFAEREQVRANEAQRVCGGVPREEIAGAWRYLLQAARAGHGPSMVRYASRRTLWGEDAMQILDGLIAYRAEGASFLQGAAQMGLPEAYEQLGFIHVTGESGGLDVPADRVKGLAYYLAMLRTATADDAARVQRNIDNAMRRWNIPQEDLARARVLAEPLAHTLLQRNAPASVDLGGGSFATDNGSHCEK